MRETIYINDKIVCFIDTIFPQDWTNDSPELICPICNEKIEPGDKMYIVIADNSHNMVFPNCFIHKLCSAHNFEDTAKNIIRLYNEYKDCISKHRAWLK